MSVNALKAKNATLPAEIGRYGRKNQVIVLKVTRKTFNSVSSLDREEWDASEKKKDPIIFEEEGNNTSEEKDNKTSGNVKGDHAMMLHMLLSEIDGGRTPMV